MPHATGMAGSGLVARIAVASTGLFLALLILLNLGHNSYRIDLTKVGGPLDVVAGLGITLLCSALGWTLVGRHLPRGRMPMSLLATCAAVGVVALGTVTLVLAWSGVYRPIPMAVLVLVCSAISVPHAVGWGNVMRFASRRVRRLAKGPIGVTWLGIQTVGLGALLVLALAPIADWDSLMYHLDLPIEFLEAGKALVPVDNRHVSYLSVVQFTYGLPLAAGLPHAINVFTLAGFGLFIGVMTELGRAFAGLRAARLAALLVWSSTSWLLVATDARVEAWASCLLALVMAAAVNAWRRIGAEPWLGAALGIVAGTAVATKLTNVPMVVCVLTAVVAMHIHRGGKVGPVVSLLGVAAVTSFPWFLKNVLAFGDPIFPFLSVAGPDPWLRSLGATSVPGISILSAARKPFDLFSWILSPGDLTIEGSGASQGLPPIVALGWIPALVWRKRERPVAAVLVAVAAVQVVFVISVSASTNLRYLQPAMVPLTLASAVGLAGLASQSKLAERLITAIVTLSLVGSAMWVTSEVTNHSFAVVSRLENSGPWLESRQTDQLVALDEFLAEEGSVRAILLYEARAAGFSTPVLQDNVDNTWQAMTTLDLSHCPDLGGSTHVVVNIGYLHYVTERGVRLNEALWGDFADFADRCLTFRSEIGPFHVYRVGKAHES